jgi:hypothetical protein
MDAVKPVVAIRQAVIVNVASEPGKRIMFGYPVNHPKERLNNKMIRTSNIISIDGDTVETKNTIYNVMDWGYD